MAHSNCTLIHKDFKVNQQKAKNDQHVRDDKFKSREGEVSALLKGTHKSKPGNCKPVWTDADMQQFCSSSVGLCSV